MPRRRPFLLQCFVGVVDYDSGARDREPARARRCGRRRLRSCRLRLGARRRCAPPGARRSASARPCGPVRADTPRARASVRRRRRTRSWIRPADTTRPPRPAGRPAAATASPFGASPFGQIPPAYRHDVSKRWLAGRCWAPRPSAALRPAGRTTATRPSPTTPPCRRAAPPRRRRAPTGDRARRFRRPAR